MLEKIILNDVPAFEHLVIPGGCLGAKCFCSLAVEGKKK